MPFHPLPKPDTHFCVSYKNEEYGLQPLCASGGFCTDRYSECPDKVLGEIEKVPEKE